jgi:hydroxymethylpyrimidine pyrophosphatase-like HAD family hydrolase
MRPLILCIDFDGTIIKNEKDYVPRSLMPNAKEVIEWANKKGCYVIIWTCRSGEMKKQMIKFLEKNDIKYDSVNKNYPKINFETSNKIYGDYYIDDRSFDINWLEIKKVIQNKMTKLVADEIEELSKQGENKC